MSHSIEPSERLPWYQRRWHPFAALGFTGFAGLLAMFGPTGIVNWLCVVILAYIGGVFLAFDFYIRRRRN